MSGTNQNDASTDANDTSAEGPDVEVPLGDASDGNGDATPESGGLGQDGTIPPDPDGVAAGHTGEQSTFEPEEDEQT